MNHVEWLEDVLPRRAGNVPGLLQHAYAFRVLGEGGGTWLFDPTATPPAARRGDVAGAPCTIGATAEDFLTLFEHPDHAIALYEQGKLAVEGELADALAFVEFLAATRGLAAGLASLIAPLTVEEFQRKWPSDHVVVHDRHDLVKTFTSSPELASVESIFEHWPATCAVFHPQSKDEVNGPITLPAHAAELFKMGAPVLLGTAELSIRGLSAWLQQIAKDLGLPANTYGRCLCYASPKGSGAGAHFDQNANFVVQLHGEKVWTIAKNETVVNPLERHVMSTPGPSPVLRSYMKGEFPTEMPPHAEKVVLRAGSVLFLPRGYWHSTVATEDALSLNFTFSQPDFIDIVVAAVQARLARHDEWRALADGFGSADPERRAKAVERLGALLGRLDQDLGTLDLQTVLAHAPGELSFGWSTGTDLRRDYREEFARPQS